MDLITDLPPTKNGYDAIATFVDRMTKRVHFAPTTKTVNAPGMAKLFRDTVYKHHGMPRVIITDRDQRFLSGFWKAVFTAVGTELRYTTAFHPQSDGQSERANRTLEEFLRHYISPLQDDWDEYLSMAEFAINDSVNPSTGYTPFYLEYGHHPLVAVDTLTPTVVPAADSFITNIKEAVEHAKTNLRETHVRQAKQANKHRRDVTFKVGDKVRLSTVNLNLPSTMSRKLAAKFAGPLTVEEVISPVTYKLKLPPTIKVHPVFHVSLLQPWRTDTEFPTHERPTPPPPVVPEDNQYIVEALLDKKVENGVVKYLVRWQGWSPLDDQWVAARNIEKSLKDDYERTHHAQLPTKPRSSRKAPRRR
jgi:hypothetical protein